MSAKYPRSPHLPWSPGGTRDDKRLLTVASLLNQEIVITEKLDGSNLAFTKQNVFARSHSGPPSHPSFGWAKALHAQLQAGISAGLTLFGEYCYAVHSIEYSELPSYFFLFGIRDDEADFWWDWDLVEEQARTLGVPTAPVLFRGAIGDERTLKELTEVLAREPSCYGPDREGIVLRRSSGFAGEDFPNAIAKYVRAGHVTSPEHWMFQQIRIQPMISRGVI